MKHRKVVGIMACDPSGVIGARGSIPWRLEAEMQHFLQAAKDGVLIMGHRTFESLPESLKDKHQCVVFSKSVKTHEADVNTTFVASLQEFELLDVPKQSKLFMIGGAEITRLFLQNNLIDEFILTIMNKEYNGDTKLDLNLLQGWAREIIRTCDDYSIYLYRIKK